MKAIALIIITIVLTTWFNNRSVIDISEVPQIKKTTHLNDKELISALSLMIESRNFSKRVPASSNQHGHKNADINPQTNLKPDAVEEESGNQDQEGFDELTVSEQEEPNFSQESFNNARREEKENMIINLEYEIDLLHDELSEKRKDREKGVIIDNDEIDSIELEIEGKRDRLEGFKEALSRT
jgi:hypothetical protein